MLCQKLAVFLFWFGMCPHMGNLGLSPSIRWKVPKEQEGLYLLYLAALTAVLDIWVLTRESAIKEY
jgi:hypothetical protein